jgi:aspartyl aminopeptidase
MDNEEKNITTNEEPVIVVPEVVPHADESKMESNDTLEDDIVRNDTIPETKDIPGSNGAFPVGAFENRRD